MSWVKNGGQLGVFVWKDVLSNFHTPSSTGITENIWTLYSVEGRLEPWETTLADLIAKLPVEGRGCVWKKFPVLSLLTVVQQKEVPDILEKVKAAEEESSTAFHIAFRVPEKANDSILQHLLPTSTRLWGCSPLKPYFPSPLYPSKAPVSFYTPEDLASFNSYRHIAIRDIFTRLGERGDVMVGTRWISETKAHIPCRLKILAFSLHRPKFLCPRTPTPFACGPP